MCGVRPPSYPRYLSHKFCWPPRRSLPCRATQHACMSLDVCTTALRLSRMLCRVGYQKSVSLFCTASLHSTPSFTNPKHLGRADHQIKQTISGLPFTRVASQHSRSFHSSVRGPFEQLSFQSSPVSLMAIPPAIGSGSSSSSDAAGNVSVDITRENFTQMLPMVQLALQQCEFYSFDCEMTGLILDTHREEFFDDMQERWVTIIFCPGV